MDGKTKNRWGMVGIGSGLHFLVDGLCLCCLYLISFPFDSPRMLGAFVTYNVLAFLSQPLTGLWADCMRQKHWMLPAAVLSLALAVLVASIWSSPATYFVSVLLGVGNSLFHVWGGKQIVLKVGNDMRALGLFVSTGAFGLSVAMVFFSWTLLYVFLLSVCLLAAAYLRADLSVADVGTVVAEEVEPKDAPRFSHIVVCLLLLLIMAFVMFRSFLGESFTSPLVKDNVVVLLIGLTAMLGKMAGGWIARRLGVVWALVLVLAVAFGCLLMHSSERGVLLTGLFTINCTMPVTLYLANLLLKGREGLAFGLLAAALIPGYLLSTL